MVLLIILPAYIPIPIIVLKVVKMNLHVLGNANNISVSDLQAIG